MKTRLLITMIVALVIASIASLSYYAIYDSSTTVFISCTSKYEQVGDKCVPLKPEQYCKEWCNAQELSKLGCTELALDHVFQTTNLFDEDFGDFYYRSLVGLPNGLSEEELETCADIIKEKRISYDLEINSNKDSEDEFTFSKLTRNKENQYCISTNEGQSDPCYSLEEIVFGNARKDWTLYPGGSGWMPPNNSTLTRIYQEVEFGIRPLDFTAMLDDKIFVNKCESSGGIWNYTYHDCEGLMQVCQDVGGIYLNENVTPYCDPLKGCNASKLVRVSCVFEYEN